MILYLQTGQKFFDWSQLLIHSVWNTCKQGNDVTLSPISKSPIHIIQLLSCPSFSFFSVIVDEGNKFIIASIFILFLCWKGFKKCPGCPIIIGGIIWTMFGGKILLLLLLLGFGWLLLIFIGGGAWLSFLFWLGLGLGLEFEFNWVDRLLNCLVNSLREVTVLEIFEIAVPIWESPSWIGLVFLMLLLLILLLLFEILLFWLLLFALFAVL